MAQPPSSSLRRDRLSRFDSLTGVRSSHCKRLSLPQFHRDFPRGRLHHLTPADYGATEQLELELGLPTDATAPPWARTVVGSRSSVLIDAGTQSWKRLGFGDAINDNVFFHLVLARLVEPTSKSDSLRVLAELGIEAPHHNTFINCLARTRQLRNVLRWTTSTPSSSRTLTLSDFDVGSTSRAATSWKNASSSMMSNPSFSYTVRIVSMRSPDQLDFTTADATRGLSAVAKSSVASPGSRGLALPASTRAARSSGVWADLRCSTIRHLPPVLSAI